MFEISFLPSMANSASTPVDNLMDISQRISANELSNTSGLEDSPVLSCSNLLDAIRVILENNPQRRNNAMLTEHQVDMIEVIEKLRTSPNVMFHYLRKCVAKHFDIDLYIVAFETGKFSLITENSYKKDSKAFLAFHEDHTVRGPLYNICASGTKQTVFPTNDWEIHLLAFPYIEKLNDNGRLVTTSAPPSVNQLHSATLIPPVPRAGPTNPRITNQVLDPLLSQAAALGTSSLNDAMVALQDGIWCLSQLVQIVQSSVPVHEMASIKASQRSVPDRTHQPDTENNAISYAPPTMSKQLKSPYRPRTLKEFVSTGSSPVSSADSNQREPLHIGVPPEDETPLYLGLAMCTDENRIHPSKVIVPDKTKAEGLDLINNNDLSCLKFDKCHPDDHFILEERQIYSKISRQERQTLRKDIGIHMLNLYQRGPIDRKKVQEEHLKKSKLALWLATRENGSYRQVSPCFFSNVIEEGVLAVGTTKRLAVEKKRKVSRKKVKSN